MIQRQFYLKLGEVLYAISTADRSVQEAEKKRIQKLIADEFSRHKTLFRINPELRVRTMA